jgi:hypothetical protein
MPAQFERRGDAMRRIEIARLQLIAAKRSFLEGVLDDATL